MIDIFPTPASRWLLVTCEAIVKLSATCLTLRCFGRVGAVALLALGGCKPVETANNSEQRTTVAAPKRDLAISFPEEHFDLTWVQPDPPDLTLPGDAGDLPPIRCGDAGTCPLPHSQCADDHTLVYYTNGRCVDGYCLFNKQFESCHGGWCSQDGCQVVVTSVPHPMIRPGT